MPREGYKTITVKQELFDELTKIAKNKNLSIPETITFLITTINTIRKMTSLW